MIGVILWWSFFGGFDMSLWKRGRVEHLGQKLPLFVHHHEDIKECQPLQQTKKPPLLAVRGMYANRSVISAAGLFLLLLINIIY